MAVDFWLGEGVDEEAYPQRSATEEQRNPRQKATPPAGQKHFAASGGVARSLQTHAGMRVTRALPVATNCSCAVSSYLSDGFYRTKVQLVSRMPRSTIRAWIPTECS